MIVAHGGGEVTNGYEIDSVEQRGGATWVHLAHDHGLKITVGRLDLIDTTGLGPYREWAARVALEAGLQPIRLRCRYGGGRSTPSLSVKYEGPGVAKQTVPASALFHAAG